MQDNKVRVGDTVTRAPYGLLSDKGDKTVKYLRGTVIYVHPLGRFHTVEFKNVFGDSYRESFSGVMK